MPGGLAGGRSHYAVGLGGQRHASARRSFAAITARLGSRYHSRTNRFCRGVPDLCASKVRRRARTRGFAADPAPVARGAVLFALGFVWASKQLYSGRLLDFNPDLLVTAWALTSLITVALAALAFQIRDATGSLWAVALSTALVASLFIRPARALWEPATRLTFTGQVHAVLAFARCDHGCQKCHHPCSALLCDYCPECSRLDGAALIFRPTSDAGAQWWLHTARLRSTDPRSTSASPPYGQVPIE